jgi:RNA polymerase sigma-70 factor (ECF subfamily)
VLHDLFAMPFDEIASIVGRSPTAARQLASRARRRVQGAATEIRGAEASARQALALSRGARFAQPALVNGAVGIVVAPRGRLSRVLRFTVAHGKIVQVDVVADPARLRQIDLAVLGA